MIASWAATATVSLSQLFGDDPDPTTLDPELVKACGERPGWACEWLFDSTGNQTAAKAVDFLVARPMKIAFILLGAWLVNLVARKAIAGLVQDLKGERGVRRRFRKVRERSGLGVLAAAQAGGTNARTAQRAESIGAVLRSAASIVIYGIGALMALAEVGVALGPLIAGAGIVGVALGFGAQSLVKDFLSGTFMLLEDQYGVGDVIDVGEAEGVVEAITLRVTRLRDVYGTVWHVPNGEIRRVGNKSQNWARLLLDVGVAYDTDIDEARRVIEETAQAMAAEDDWAHKFLDAPELWGVQALAADAVTIRLVAKVVPGEQWAMERELRGRVKHALDEAGVEIPFPQRTVWLRREESDDSG